MTKNIQRDGVPERALNYLYNRLIMSESMSQQSWDHKLTQTSWKVGSMC